MTEWSRAVMADLGYLGIGLLMLVENLFPPIPSEVVLPLAGYTAARGELAIAPVVLVAAAGSLAGALALYWAGAALGRERLRAFVEHHGRWLTLAPEDLERSERWFERHGGKAVFLCRLVPGLRSLISVPAGLVRMSLPRFLLLSTVGTVVWCAILAVAGQALGEEYERVSVVLDPILYAVIGSVVVVYLVRVVRWRRQRDG